MTTFHPGSSAPPPGPSTRPGAAPPLPEATSSPGDDFAPRQAYNAHVPPPPSIAHQPHQRAAVIRLIIPRAHLSHHIASVFPELLSTLADQRLAPTGPLFAHYLRITPTVLDLELGLPVPTPVRAFGRVDPGQLPACIVARTLHHGPWSNLANAWQQFDLWLSNEPRHIPASDLWELFHTAPDTTPDPAHHRTELLRRVRPGIRPASAQPSSPPQRQLAGGGVFPPQIR